MPENTSCSGASTCTKESCEGCPSKKNPQSMQEPMNAYSDVKHVIGVVSGKGGVGKSFVTASLATQMAKAGYKVGILDADITGPSIPKMFGAHGQLVGDEKGMYPYETPEGLKIVSINLLMEDEEAPVVWRGPVIAGAVKQFWNETVAHVDSESGHSADHVSGVHDVVGVLEGLEAPHEADGVGVVSLSKMTTDLLPDMSLQYAMIITTDMGASPEKVESEVTAPIESAMATTSNIKNISSISYNSYSIVTLVSGAGTYSGLLHWEASS